MMLRPASVRSAMRGLTLVELMVAFAIGLLVVLAATGLLLSTRTAYLGQDDQVQLHEGARYALELIGRAVRQTGYENWDAKDAPILTTEAMSPHVFGLDAHRLKSTAPGVDGAISSASEVVNGSDVLALRFLGSGSPADGSMLNCTGFPVAAPASQAEADEGRGWSIFYVAKTGKGEPALYCKYRGWAAEVVVFGVESFQALYGVDLDDDGIADQYLRAAAMSGPEAWKRVVVVRIGLLMRARNNTRADGPSQEYHLFGPAYSNEFASVDPGVHIRESDLPTSERSRMRAQFGATIQLRNRTRGST